MTTAQPDAAIQAQHEELFETQIGLQTRLIDYIEQVDEFQVLDEAWEEFINYEPRDMDPEDPEPVLHFFPWALFYWRRDVPQDELEAARDEMLGLDGDAPEADKMAQAIAELADEDDTQGDDVDYTSLPSIAVMFMNSVDGADGPDSEALEQTLNPLERQFIEAASQAPYSFFKVSAVGPGAFVTIEDLIVPKQTTVYAPALVDMSEEDDIIYAQVVSLGDANLMVGVAPAVLPPVVQEPIEQVRERIEALVPEIGEDWRYELEFELRALYHQMVENLQESVDDIDDIEDIDDIDIPQPSSPTKH